MSIISNLKSYNVSEARDQLYSLIRSAASGLNTIEINLRGVSPVLLISKSELEAWQETYDVLKSTKEIRAVRRARREKKTISHREVLKKLGITDADSV